MIWLALLFACSGASQRALPSAALARDDEDDLALFYAAVEHTGGLSKRQGALVLDDGDRERRLELYHNRGAAIVEADPTMVHWFGDFSDLGSGEVVTLDYTVRWTPKSGASPSLLAYAVEAIAIQAVDGRDRYRWVRSGAAWSRQTQAPTPPDWTDHMAIRDAVARWIVAHSTFDHAWLPTVDRHSGKLYDIAPDKDLDTVIPIDEDSARWLVGAHTKGDEAMVIDFAVDWDGTQFVINGVDVQSLQGQDRYRWEGAPATRVHQ
jgi:hypothetical protein